MEPQGEPSVFHLVVACAGVATVIKAKGIEGRMRLLVYISKRRPGEPVPYPTVELAFHPVASRRGFFMAAKAARS